MRMRPIPLTAAVAAWVAVGAVVAFGCFLRLVDPGPLPIDSWWNAAVSVERGSPQYAVAVFCAEIGTAVGVAALGAIAMGLLFAIRRRNDAAAVATALLLGVGASQLLKTFVLRPRPTDPLYATSGSSYPSGHSMGAAALAVSLALAFTALDRVSARTARLVWVVAAAWVLLMMWSRTALHVHWLSDTVCGALLGTAAAVLSRRLWAGRGEPPEPAQSVAHGR